MDTKTDGISSGLVPVAWLAPSNYEWPSHFISLTEIRDGEALVRLSDAEAIIQQQAEGINELETEFAGCSSLLDNAERIMEQQSAALKLSRDALTEMQDLIEESGGVYGLHLNGDESPPWGEIEQGGRFERFMTLPEALAAIDRLEANNV